MAVDNVVRREEDVPFKVGGVQFPTSSETTLNLQKPPQGFTLDHEIELDDDCYTGKDVTSDDCVDFDPPHA
jgi:hypothetical protein